MRKKPENLQDLMKWYDDTIDELTLENEILKEDIENMKSISENQILYEPQSNESGLIKRGKEKDLYPNEVKEVLLDVLRSARQNLIPDNSRRADIIDDILKNNPSLDIPRRRAEAFQVALKGYKAMDATLRKELTNMGLVIPINIKDHHKATYYGDSRYKMSFAASCSDRRGGDNIAAEITRRFL